MSMPITYCEIAKAADDPKSFAELHPIIKHNLEYGSFTVIGCECDPPCRDLTDEESDQLWARFEQPLADTSVQPIVMWRYAKK